MESANLYITFLKIKRGSQIIFIIFKHTFLRLFSDPGTRVYHTNKKVKTSHTTPQRLRMLIEELGPTYIKFGQIIADRPDIASEEFRIEFKKLQSKTVPFKTETAIAIIEHELNKPLESIFKDFDKAPYASASIGQVYIASLKSGEKVIVKVQRPNIENKIKLDIKLMRHFARLISKKHPNMAALNISSIVDSFSETIISELDYKNEQNNIDLFGYMFKGDCCIVIPKSYPSLTTKRVLVMEYIDGISPDDSKGLERFNINKNIAMKNGAQAAFKMILDYGIYHADPHPGNLFILKNNSIAFIDFGMVGVLRIRELNFLADYTIGYTKKDSLLITKAFLTLCDIKYFEREDDLRFDIHKMLLKNFDHYDLHIENFSQTLRDSLDLVLKYKLSLPPGIFLLVKTMITLEKFSEILGVDINLTDIIMPYSKKIAKERYSTKNLANKIYDTLLDYIHLIQTTPKDMAEIMYKIKQGKIFHEINIENSDTMVTNLRKISLRLSYTIILIGLFIGSSIIFVMNETLFFGKFILYTTYILIILLIIKWIFKRK